MKQVRRSHPRGTGHRTLPQKKQKKRSWKRQCIPSKTTKRQSDAGATEERGIEEASSQPTSPLSPEKKRHTELGQTVRRAGPREKKQESARKTTTPSLIEVVRNEIKRTERTSRFFFSFFFFPTSLFPIHSVAINTNGERSLNQCHLRISRPVHRLFSFLSFAFCSASATNRSSSTSLQLKSVHMAATGLLLSTTGKRTKAEKDPA